MDVRCTCSGLDCVLFGYQVEIQAGASGSTADRRLVRTGGSETLKYGLYRDLARTQPWGVGPNSAGAVYLLSLFGSVQRLSVYGAIPAGQAVRAGTYRDTPLVVITY